VGSPTLLFLTVGCPTFPVGSPAIAVGRPIGPFLMVGHPTSCVHSGGLPPILVGSPTSLITTGGMPHPDGGLPHSYGGPPHHLFPISGQPHHLRAISGPPHPNYLLPVGCPINYTVGHPTIFVSVRATPPILFSGCGLPLTRLTPHWWAAPQFSCGAGPLVHFGTVGTPTPLFFLSFFGRDGLLWVVLCRSLTLSP
jgi:hypothetical protein